MSPGETSGGDHGGGIPRLEWACATIGAALVAAMVIFLAHEAVTSGSSPPDISVTVDAVVEVRQGFLVQIAAENLGDRTATGVKVEGVLHSRSGTVEASEMTFQHLPARSPRRAGLFFTRDPRRFELVLKTHGYEPP